MEFGAVTNGKVSVEPGRKPLVSAATGVVAMTHHCAAVPSSESTHARFAD